MTPQQLEELIQLTLKDFWEVHQQEIDRRFDRLVERIAESELSVRRHIDRLLEQAVTEDEVRTWWLNFQQELDKHFRRIEVEVSESKLAIGDLKSDLRSGRSIYPLSVWATCDL